MKAQLEAQRIQLEGQVKAQLLEMEYRFKMQLAQIEGQSRIAVKDQEIGRKEQLDITKEDRKDERVKKQAVQQSKLISQRQGQRQELEDMSDVDPLEALL